MTLHDWLAKHGYTEREAETMLGVTQQTINRLSRFKQAPTLRIALLVEEGTKGEVKPHELLSMDERRAIYGRRAAP